MAKLNKGQLRQATSRLHYAWKVNILTPPLRSNHLELANGFRQWVEICFAPDTRALLCTGRSGVAFNRLLTAVRQGNGTVALKAIQKLEPPSLRSYTFRYFFHSSENGVSELVSRDKLQRNLEVLNEARTEWNIDEMDYVVVKTDPMSAFVKRRKLNFGEFLISVHPPTTTIKVEPVSRAEQGVLYSSTYKVYHPHLKGTELCMGGGANAARRALKRWDILSVVELCEGVLRQYNGRSPHYDYGHWLPRMPCGRCNASTREDSLYLCEDCDTRVCPGCQVADFSGGEIVCCYGCSVMSGEGFRIRTINAIQLPDYDNLYFDPRRLISLDGTLHPRSRTRNCWACGVRFASIAIHNCLSAMVIKGTSLHTLQKDITNVNFPDSQGPASPSEVEESNVSREDRDARPTPTGPADLPAGEANGSL